MRKHFRLFAALILLSVCFRVFLWLFPPHLLSCHFVFFVVDPPRIQCILQSNPARKASSSASKPAPAPDAVHPTLAAVYGLHAGVDRVALADLRPWIGTPSPEPTDDQAPSMTSV